MSKTLFVFSFVILVVLLLFIYPTAFDQRSNIYEYTKWAADISGMLLAYLAIVVVYGLVPVSGGKMKKGLTAFLVGMVIMGLSFIFGPVMDHYHVFHKNKLDALHGLEMLGGMIGYLLANYWFINIVRPQAMNKRDHFLYVAVFLIFLLLFFLTAVIPLQPYPAKYWYEAVSFSLGGVMLSMTVINLGKLGDKYKKVVRLMLISIFFMFISLYQPEHFLIGAKGGTFHHGMMVISIIFFLATVVYLSKLEVYSGQAQRQTDVDFIPH